MPSLKNYKTLLELSGKTNGQALKKNSDQILEAHWYNDVATRTCYLFDYYHDPQPLKLNDLTPDETKQTPIDLRYIVNSSQTLDKDAVSYHIMFKPSEDGKSSLVDYYDEYFKNRYDALFPCGLYVLIPDNDGIYNKWLIVAPANVNDPQFATYEVLRCDKLIQWIYKNTKYQMCGVLRSQNSYNSGVWMDYKVETIENQQKFILPLTRETEYLFYNQRMIIDNKVLTEPLAWRITKVNRVSQSGVTKITLAQDKFDQNKDYIELDSNGNVIGMWADYYSQGQVTPDEPVEENADIYSTITYSGVKPEIKINGSYKKFTVTFYNQEGQIDYQTGDWSYDIRNGEIITPITDVSGILDVSTSGLSDNQIKVKFVGDDSYLNKVLIINHTAVINGNNIVSHLEVEITSL